MTTLGRWSLVAAAAMLVAALPGQWPPLPGEEEEPALLGLLPGAEEVEGWPVVEDTLAYCPTPDSLTDIYDGGYEFYVEAGVQQAVVQAYEHEDALLLVYLHRMASSEQPEAICEEFHDSLGEGSGSLEVLEAKDGGFLYVGGGQSSAYLWRDYFYCNIVASGEEEPSQNAVKEFLEVVGEKIASYLGEDEEAEEEEAPDDSGPAETDDAAAEDVAWLRW